jgi:hypothetical protein
VVKTVTPLLKKEGKEVDAPVTTANVVSLERTMELATVIDPLDTNLGERPDSLLVAKAMGFPLRVVLPALVFTSWFNTNTPAKSLTAL